jgi:hypothetical protein
MPTAIAGVPEFRNIDCKMAPDRVGALKDFSLHGSSNW